MNDLDRAKDHLRQPFANPLKGKYHCYHWELGEWVFVDMDMDAPDTADYLNSHRFFIDFIRPTGLSNKPYVGKYATWTS